MFGKRSTAEKLVDDARDFAAEIVNWLENRIDDAPDAGEIRDTVTGTAQDALDIIKERMEGVAEWLTDFARDAKEALPEIVEEDESSGGGKGTAVVATAAAVTAGWYFFEPNNGPKRRQRFSQFLKDAAAKIKGLLIPEDPKSGSNVPG